ncbi:MAG: phosphoribosylaminoimidazolesuccinocarboxamide synthase [Candidatus Doudnabacteria bacterium]|nr:phosphoribosylaminoimidazolesuccinocarboxamide synthase [Candidatus Doudnabacteria bacterium]
MSAVLPKKVAELEVSRRLLTKGLSRISQGKVRDIFRVVSDKLLMVATDRISIFDFVLPATVPKKGEVLNALTHFWITGPLSQFVSHFVFQMTTSSNANAITDWKFVDQDVYPELVKRGMLVHRCQIPPWEIVFRLHLGGSVYKEYLETGKVAGVRLKVGIPKWAKLRRPLFTPATKAESGHDENISQQKFRQGYKDWSPTGDDPQLVIDFFRSAYNTAYDYACSHGILILDTKFEGNALLADEVLTPDSSRFTTSKDWEAAMKEKRDPIFYDKEFVRQWGRAVETRFGVTGINKLNPGNPEHVAFVHGLQVPNDVILATTQRYLEIFRILTGEELGNYQKRAMGVP